MPSDPPCAAPVPLPKQPSAPMLLSPMFLSASRPHSSVNASPPRFSTSSSVPPLDAWPLLASRPPLHAHPTVSSFPTATSPPLPRPEHLAPPPSPPPSVLSLSHTYVQPPVAVHSFPTTAHPLIWHNMNSPLPPPPPHIVEPTIEAPSYNYLPTVAAIAALSALVGLALVGLCLLWWSVKDLQLSAIRQRMLSEATSTSAVVLMEMTSTAVHTLQLDVRVDGKKVLGSSSSAHACASTLHITPAMDTATAPPYAVLVE
eukprot:6212888-Pleurochrysis_carterae.AAC.6